MLFRSGGTTWGYPFVQLIHFFGLSLWVGTIVMLDLRLMGLAARGQTVTDFYQQLFPWTWTGLAIVVIGGFLLFSAAAETYYHNPAFQVKVPLLLIGIAYHVVIQCQLRKWDQPGATPALAKIAGASELALWIGVITAAVSIPNY